MLDQFSDTETIGRRIGWYRDEQTRCGVEARPHQIAVTRGLMLVDDEAKPREEIERRLKAIAMLPANARVPAEAAAAPVAGSQMSDSSHEATEESTGLGPNDAGIPRPKARADARVDN